jgi:hypothetical protein
LHVLPWSSSLVILLFDRSLDIVLILRLDGSLDVVLVLRLDCSLDIVLILRLDRSLDITLILFLLQHGFQLVNLVFVPIKLDSRFDVPQRTGL